jgi:hypothetical protein
MCLSFSLRVQNSEPRSCVGAVTAVRIMDLILSISVCLTANGGDHSVVVFTKSDTPTQA